MPTTWAWFMGRNCRICGAVLARDNAGECCSGCARTGSADVDAPPTLPEGFWENARIREALGSWHFGKVIRAYRHHPHHGSRPLPQERVAAWLGIEQGQLSRIENGPQITDLAKLTDWAQCLRVPAHLLWFKLPGQRDQPLASTRKPRGPHEQDDGTEPVELDAAVAAAMQSFRAADRKVGGGYLYATVVTYLQTAIGPRLLHPVADDGRVLTAASALCEMAGWMAHDAGRSPLADRHFARAFDFSQAGTDPLLSAHVLASRSHLAHHTDLPVDAVHFARRGHEVLRGAPPNPGLRARLLAMEARGHAALNDARTCGKYLAQAETVLDEPRSDVSSPWISGFDEGSLASEAARCMKQLGRHASASRHAEQVIALRSADSHTRSRAFGQLMLATVLTEWSRPDEACAVAREALTATSSLSSYLVIEQLQQLRQLLRPYRANVVVKEFLAELTGELATRSTIHQWLGAGPGRSALVGGELP